MKIITVFLAVFLTFTVWSQQGPNFTITTPNGQTHRLYEDYLNQGKIVVLKIFFADCPPCNSSAPGFQAQYVNYGSGTQDVQFMALSNKSWDDNTKINGFINRAGLTMPVAGASGGSVAAQAMYTNGTFGPFFGTPHYILIAPDRTVHNDVTYDDIATLITDIRNNNNNPAPYTPVQLQPNIGNTLPQGVSIMLKPKNANNPIYNLTALTNGTHRFDYPSDQIPTIDNPVIYLQSTAPALNGQLRTNDLIQIRSHILALNEISDAKLLLAADVNGDGRIRSNDLTALRKVILGIDLSFPNNVPSYIMYPREVDFNISGTELVNIPIEIIKMGNVTN